LRRERERENDVTSSTLFSPHRAHAHAHAADAALFYERLLATALFLDVVDA
jgi:hypothetical protein